ncbi:MAG: hypothetical protein NVS2B16_11280 [Chloroflexota bacterium]
MHVSGAPQPTIRATTVLPLRFFLGFTFLYASLQKVTDPGFLHPGSPSYIGTQVRQFSQGSPLSWPLVHVALPHPVLTGFVVISAEWAIGVLVVLGLLTRLAALSGLLLNFGLFLSASWNVYPYFLGSDIVFVVAWLTLLMAGPGPFAMDRLRGKQRQSAGADGFREASHSEAFSEPILRTRLSRFQLLLAGLTTSTLVVLGIVPRRKSSTPALSGAVSSPSHARAPGWRSPAGSHRVGNISQVPINAAASFSNPTTGTPALIVRLSSSVLRAFDATCTHAGCTVDYDPESQALVCPCHGAEFDPRHGARVTRGPAVASLSSLPLSIDPDGNMYVIDKSRSPQ